MALILKSSASSSSNCKNIIFKDSTGAESGTNLGGWGAGNVLLINVTSSNIIIKDSTGAVLVNILNPAGIPTDVKTFEYTITSTVLNGGTTIPDGLYIIEYTINVGAIVHTTGNKYFLFTCGLDCCVDQLFANIAESDDCSCTDTVITNALYANALLKGLKALKNCGNINGMNSLITKLKTICSSTGNCGCS